MDLLSLYECFWVSHHPWSPHFTFQQPKQAMPPRQEANVVPDGQQPTAPTATTNLASRVLTCHSRDGSAHLVTTSPQSPSFQVGPTPGFLQSPLEALAGLHLVQRDLASYIKPHRR